MNSTIDNSNFIQTPTNLPHPTPDNQRKPKTYQVVENGRVVTKERPYIDPRTFKLPSKTEPSRDSNPQPQKTRSTTSDYGQAALEWFDFGYAVIPILPGKKFPAVSWDGWRNNLSRKSIKAYWERHPDHEIGFFVKEGFVFFDADTPEALDHLERIEKSFSVTPKLVIKTTRGGHHHYRLAPDAYARTKSFNTLKFPHRIDTKCVSGILILPPSTGKSIILQEAFHASELSEAPQDFIDAIFAHNGLLPPRPPQNQPATQADYLKPEPESVSEQADFTSRTLHELRVLINALGPDESYDDWSTVGMILHHETDGSEEGFSLFDDWSRKGAKYPGIGELRNKWQSFKRFMGKKRTIATLKWMLAARDVDWRELLAKAEPDFEVIPPDAEHEGQLHELSNCSPKTNPADDIERDHEAQVENTAGTAGDTHQTSVTTIAPDEDQSLAKYSLQGKLAELQLEAEEVEYALPRIAILGQLTVLYASPNIGKTLLTMRMLIDSIRQGILESSKVYYINADDSFNGLMAKLRLAEQWRFHMIAPGYQDFSEAKLLPLIMELTAREQAKGIVIILDTAKKFTDVMDKTSSSRFTRVLRKFVAKGGTCILLAHANKNRGANGKSVPGGTSDLLDDADCAYVIDEVSKDERTKTRLVEFDNRKQRGYVARTAAYRYSIAEHLPYADLVASVEEVDADTLEAVKQAEGEQADEAIIEAIKTSIRQGNHHKMDLIRTAAIKSGASLRTVTRILDLFTGTEPTLNQWYYTKGQRGALIYALHEA